MISDYLTSDIPAETYLTEIDRNAAKYNGFNLLVGDTAGLYYYSNRQGMLRRVEPGLYGLSNHFLDTPWPKVAWGKTGLQALLQGKKDPEPEKLFQLLHNKTRPKADQLPETGVGLRWEKILSPLFITSKTYGTRSSSLLLVSKSKRILFSERTYSPARLPPPKSFTRTFYFAPDFIFSHQASRSLMVFS